MKETTLFVKVRLCLGAALAAAALGAPAVVAGWFGILGPEVARAHGPGSDGAPPTLAYACGNTFVVTNVGRSPVTATFRVAGVREEGLVRVPAAPEEDPYSSEVLIETQGTGTVQLFEGERRVAVAENGQVPCAPQAPVAARAAAAAPIDTGEWR